MIVLFCNVRGLGKPTKHRMMTKIIIGTKEDIVYMCETKLTVPITHLTIDLGARRFDQWVSKDFVGASGGTMIGFNSSSYILEDEWIGRFSLSMVLKGRKDIFL